ncbi:hypothetical protein N7452_000741 [Penicillium brevicompactum]|uniref:Uncharacterized protein n=1 Tax=Penicillium brevicompactum TaxID=5074 RepID=A0A9W9R107_PENBR|nr:hypothetical protein N7452_000741 [Penicillium brevicompactum]
MLAPLPQPQQWMHGILVIVSGDEHGNYALLDALKCHYNVIRIQQVSETVFDTDSLKLDC